VKYHGEALRRLIDDEDLVRQVVDDYALADLNGADRAMLDYAAKLTRDQQGMSEADVDGLRDTGFDDRAILDIAQITAYFAYATRIANGLGVQLESYEPARRGRE
jgi:uncharacterized peroxidase-related enzyme